jgi:Domain of unknown function (DUF4136)
MKYTFNLNKLSTTVLLLTALLINGCTSSIRSHVTTYQRLEPAALAQTSKSFFIAPNSTFQDLEFEHYKQLLIAELGPLDFIEAKDPSKAQYRIEFEIQSSKQNRTTLDYLPPMHWGATRGIYGHGGRYMYDPFLTTPIPVERTIEYTRYALKVSMFDTLHSPEKPVWEGKAFTDINKTKNTTNLSADNIAPYLIRSVLSGFPGENGSTKIVRLPQKKAF